jgi:lysozyme
VSDDLRDLLIAEEGEKLSAYQDHLGYWTIGVGHLIDARKGGSISRRISRLMLDEDIEVARVSLLAALPWAVDLDPVRLNTLIAMAFQMGVSGVLKFKLTLAYLRGDHFDQAADEMLDSTWAKQTPERAKRMAERIRTGIS